MLRQRALGKGEIDFIKKHKIFMYRADEVNKSSAKDIGLSIAEYNPKKDINNKTKNIAYEILKIYLEG